MNSLVSGSHIFRLVLELVERTVANGLASSIGRISKPMSLVLNDSGILQRLRVHVLLMSIKKNVRIV